MLAIQVSLRPPRQLLTLPLPLNICIPRDPYSLRARIEKLPAPTMRLATNFGLVLAVLELSACERPNSVEYYRAHPKEMNERIADCVVQERHDTDCANAKAAYPDRVQVGKAVPSGR